MREFTRPVASCSSSDHVYRGAFFFTRLTRTELEVDLPLIGLFPPGAPDAGVTPDVVVSRPPPTSPPVATRSSRTRSR